MSRLRWGLGAALALVALLAAASALQTYLGHKLWLGGVAVVALVAIDLVGFGSLALARRRLAGELLALTRDPPSGTLFAERKRHLQAILATAARPDLDALAEATAAAELGRAYLGKYLVAVTVLVGLVGTFAGLMETLRGVAPLLADERITTLQALAGPLAGLDVTFGASLVGILVTLALALVQGDLALAEEAVLARLEERTRHVLLPALWPPAEAADERAARELSALRGELVTFVARATEAAGERVARVAAVEVDKLVQAVRATVEDSVQGTSTRVEKGLFAMASAFEAKLAPMLATQAEQLTSLRSSAAQASANAVEAGARAADAIALAAERALVGMSQSVEGLSAAQRQLVGEAVGAVDKVAGASLDSVQRLEVALRTLGESQVAASTLLLEAHAEEATRLGTAQSQASARAEAAVQRLTDAQGEAAARTEAAVQRLTDAQAARAAQLDAMQVARAAQLDESQAKRAAEREAAQAAHLAHLDEVQAESARRAAAALNTIVEAHAAEATRLAQAHSESVQKVQAALHALTVAQAAQGADLQLAHAASVQRVEAALQALTAAQAAQGTDLAQAHAASVREVQAALQSLAVAQAAQGSAIQLAQAEAAARVETALSSLVDSHAERLTATAETLCEAVRASVGSEGLRLGDAVQALGKAAAELGSAAHELGGPMAALTPELQALAREVALLAARGESEAPAATLDELMRLGEGVERLESLLRMTQDPRGGIR